MLNSGQKAEQEKDFRRISKAETESQLILKYPQKNVITSWDVRQDKGEAPEGGEQLALGCQGFDASVVFQGDSGWQAG